MAASGEPTLRWPMVNPLLLVVNIKKHAKQTPRQTNYAPLHPEEMSRLETRSSFPLWVGVVIEIRL